MDAAEFLKQFQDHLAPRLDTYEQALYLYAVRHSRLEGRDVIVIGFKSARSALAFGIGKAGSPMSERVCYEKLRCLQAKGCLELLGTERGGTKLRVRLPACLPPCHKFCDSASRRPNSLSPSFSDGWMWFARRPAAIPHHHRPWRIGGWI